jgi:ABC-2 type transport system permease protein
MFNERTIAIMKRELREKLMSKAFIIATILLPVFMIGIIALQTFVMSFDDDKNTSIEIITEDYNLTAKFESSFNELSFVKDTTYTLSFTTLAADGLKEYIESKKQLLIDEKLNGIIFIPDSALSNKEVQYYSKIPNNRSITEKLDGHINKVLLDQYFSEKGLSENELRFARMGVDINGFKVSDDEEFKEQGYGNLILSYLFTFLIYLSAIMSGQMLMSSVQEEKTSKIVEVILSSVQSKELMTGKILGGAITSSFQMIIWLVPVIILISTSWFMLPPKFTLDITLWHLTYFVFNFFLGLIIYLGLFATVGAIFDTAQEAQSGMWPVLMLIMIPFFISFSVLRDPSNTIAEVSSFIPFATIIVMPGRMVAGEVPMWQLFASILVNIGTIAAIFPIAGKIYRVGILRTGKKPTWGQVIKWLKFKY